MPSEFHKSSESAQEAILDELQGKSGDSDRGWIRWVALSAMLMALFSAIGALLAGITSNESLMIRTEEILEISRLESDRLHVEVLRSKHDILKSMGKTPEPAELERIEAYEKEAADLSAVIAREEIRVGIASQEHSVFAIGVTLLSIAITLSGMAIMANRQTLWYIGIVFGLAGYAFVILGISYFFKS